MARMLSETFEPLDIARDPSVNYDFVIDNDEMDLITSYCVGVGAWQAAMDTVHRHNLCPTLHGKPLYDYLVAWEAQFNADIALNEAFCKYRTK